MLSDFQSKDQTDQPGGAVVTQPQGIYVDGLDQQLAIQLDPKLHPDHTFQKKIIKFEIIGNLPTFVGPVTTSTFHFFP